jgi:integrase
MVKVHEKGVNTYYRLAKPSGAHKSYRVQELNILGKWITLKLDSMDALNKLFKAGRLSEADANNRAEAILAGLYKERDRDKIVGMMMPGNIKLLNEYLAFTYTPAKLRRMYKSSHKTAVTRLIKMLESLADIPIDGDINVIQNRLDDLFASSPPTHEKMTMAANRLRKWLGLRHAEHLREEAGEVSYITYDEFKAGLKTCPEPEKTIAAVAFYAGLRPSEILGLEARDLKGDVLRVERQPHRDVVEALPKMLKKRKAFVMKDGVRWVEEWLKMNADKNVMYTPSIIREHFKIHLYGLRHSYAVHLIGMGATLDWISQSMGNTRETCERHYSGHVLSNDSLDMLRRLK